MSRKKYEPKFRFVLVDNTTGRFPKTYNGLICPKQFTDRLDETYIFDDRDDQNSKIDFYNALYRSIAEFEAFVF